MKCGHSENVESESELRNRSVFIRFLQATVYKVTYNVTQFLSISVNIVKKKNHTM